MKKLLAAALLALAAPAGAALFLGPIKSQLKEPKRLFDAGQYGAVIASLNPAEMQKLKSEDLKRAYFYMGASYARTGQFEKALGVYQLGVKLFPNDINLLTDLASLLHRTGLEEDAQPLFQKVLQIHPNNAPSHLGLAEIDHALGFLERSAEHYEKALETMGDRPEIWRDYAEVLLAQRDSRTAELAIRKALDLSPDADSWIDLALILRAQGRLDEALETLDKASGPAPRADIDLARALWLFEAGRDDQAAAAAEGVLKSSPQDPLARFIRARVRLKKGFPEKAAEDLKVAAAAELEAPFVAKAAAKLLGLIGKER